MFYVRIDGLHFNLTKMCGFRVGWRWCCLQILNDESWMHSPSPSPSSKTTSSNTCLMHAGFERVHRIAADGLECFIIAPKFQDNCRAIWSTDVDICTLFNFVK